MISDVRRRELALNTEYRHPVYINVNQLYDKLLESYNSKYINRVLQNWDLLDENKTLAFAKVLDLLEEVYMKGNIGDINKTTSYIVENIIPKIRDASQMQYHIKRKIGNIKTKISTKVNNKVEDINNAIAANVNQISKIANATASVAPKKQENTNTKESRDQEEKENTVKESMEKILSEANNMVKYDRIISNHKKLCKRFNIDRVVKESVFTSSMVPDCVIELCKLIDTYNMPITAKYSVCLESSLFALDKNGVPYDRKDIVNNVSDYFLMTYSEKADIPAAIKRLADTSVLYKLSDFDDLDYIISKSQANKQFDVFFNRESEIFSLDILDDKTFDNFQDIEEGAKNVVNKITAISKEAKNKASNAVDEFKMLPKKTPEKIKETIRKIFTDKAENITKEYASLLRLVFSMIIITGSIAIHPVIGVLSFGAVYFMQMKFQREETKKMLEVYKKEKEHAEKRMKTLKTEDSKERCSEYIKMMDHDIKKIEDYYDNLLTDEEKYGSDDDTSDDDFMKNFTETAKNTGEELAYASSIVDYISNSEKEYPNSSMMRDIEKNIANMDCKDLDIIKEFSVNHPDMIDPFDLSQIYTNCLMETRRLKEISKYVKIDCLNENINDLIACYTDNKEKDLEENYNALEDLYNIAVTRDCIKEYFQNISSNTVSINEMDFSNTINLLVERVKKSALNLSDKEKIMSRTLDSNLDMIKNSIENALTQENREAVIRGNILPPFSKIIKLTLTAGAVSWLIHPAIAIIGLIGVFAVNKNLRTKERQIIMDELDVELTMTDKYIHIAEDRNQMKNLRNLLMIKKKLEAQRNRLKYKMDIEWKTQYNPSSSGEENDYNDEY